MRINMEKETREIINIIKKVFYVDGKDVETIIPKIDKIVIKIKSVGHSVEHPTISD